MTKLEAIAFFMDMDECTHGGSEPIQMAIKALKQEPREDEVILTKKEYGELVSSEFDNGYTKGYTEALEQNDVLNKIKAEIEQIEINGHIRDVECFRAGINAALNVINKYKAGE